MISHLFVAVQLFLLGVSVYGEVKLHHGSHVHNLLLNKHTISKNQVLGSKTKTKAKALPGWGVISFFPNEGCSGSPITVYGLKTNVCFNSYDQSFMVTCGELSGGFNTYNGSDCNPQFLYTRDDSGKFSTCQPDKGQSTRSVCTADGVHLPLPKGDWFSYQAHTEDRCNSTVEIVAFPNGKCLDFDDSSRKFNFPMIYDYENSLCADDPVNTMDITGEDKCRTPSPFDAAADVLPIPTQYSLIKLITVTTTPPMPPVKDASMKFQLAQTIVGFTAADYTKDKSNNDKIMGKTLAAVLPGILPDYITILSVLDVSAASGAVVGILAQLRKIGTSSTTGVVIKYEVNFPSISVSGFNDAQQAYNVTISTLQASLADGSFTTILTQTAATQSSGSPLTTATASPSITYTTYTDEPINSPSDSSSSSSTSSSSLSAGAIAGIVIGAVVFVGLLLAAGFMFGQNRNSVLPTSTIKPNSAIVQPAY